MTLYYYGDNSYLLVNAREITKFKSDNKNINFPTQFCLRSIPGGFSATGSSKVSLNGNAYDFSVEYNPIEKSDILNKYLIYDVQPAYCIIKF